MPRKLPKVNARKAAELFAEAAKGGMPNTPVMSDARFAAMFEDARFAIDEGAPEYMA